MWHAEEVRFDILYDDSEGAVITVTIHGPGADIDLMGEVREEGTMLVVERAHVRVRGGVKVLTAGTMAAVAARVMQETGYDEILVEGAVRTTGARAGYRPRAFRFTRGYPPDPGPG